MIISPARRTAVVQEYYFSRKLAEIARMNRSRLANGLEPVVNLGIGAPDGMPPLSAVQALVEEAGKSGVHAYQNYRGIPELRKAFASWYRRYYDVDLNPEEEIQPLAGSKEGILLLSLAFLDEGDGVLVPDPGYPTYTSASLLSQARIIRYDLSADNGWQPDFEQLEAMNLSGVKVMWVNYPHMPTGARATKELFARLVDFGKRHGILVVNDNPYSFILNDNPLSILSVPKAKECCMELNSLSKAHNMSGWRIGMIAGCKELVSEVLKVKSQMDSGMFRPLQVAAARALSEGPEWFEALNADYMVRKEEACKLFDTLGVAYNPSSSGLFLWGKISPGNAFVQIGEQYGQQGDDRSLGEKVSDALLYKGGIFITPGFIFGRNGRDYVRVSLCAKPEVLRKAGNIAAGLL